uniref:Protein kinase domain-containing protein n=1 Tax=Meloidogyne hapla TaxID=6305 RepID=A0A1I8BXK4_MELHA
MFKEVFKKWSTTTKRGLESGQKFLNWVVMDRIGAGTFGEVYRVRGSTGQLYALKTEHCDAGDNVLMMDVTVLQDATRLRLKHFPRIIESGRYRNDFFYLVMTLLGKSLHDLRKARKSEHFTMGTAIGTAIQTLEAIEELHKIGYLHRDIKPGNYSVGLPDRKGNLRTIYLLDFGMCRRYVKEDNTLRRPRSAAGFRGTPRYAALRCHMIYMIVEMTTAGLPWRRLENMDELGEQKRRVHAAERVMLRDLFIGCPTEYRVILQYVIALGYYDVPQYQTVLLYDKKLTKISHFQYYDLLRQALTTKGVSEFPFDWEKEQQQKD